MPVFPTIVAPGALKSHLQPATPLSAVSRDEADLAVRKAREMFGRTLACWAGDLLALRSRGLHVATWPTGTPSRRLKRAA